MLLKYQDGHKRDYSSRRTIFHCGSFKTHNGIYSTEFQDFYIKALRVEKNLTRFLFLQMTNHEQKMKEIYFSICATECLMPRKIHSKTGILSQFCRKRTVKENETRCVYLLPCLWIRVIKGPSDIQQLSVV